MQNEVEKQMNRSTTSTLSEWSIIYDRCGMWWICALLLNVVSKHSETILKCKSWNVFICCRGGDDLCCLKIEDCGRVRVINRMYRQMTSKQLFFSACWVTVTCHLLWSCNDVHHMLDLWCTWIQFLLSKIVLDSCNWYICMVPTVLFRCSWMLSYNKYTYRLHFKILLLSVWT